MGFNSAFKELIYVHLLHFIGTQNLMDMFTAEIRQFARKHEARLLYHENFEAIQLLDNSELLRRLKRTKPFELVS